MSNKKYITLKKELEFMNNLKNKSIDREQIDLCKKFISFNWSNHKSVPGKILTVHSYIAKHLVEHLFGKYISNEAFILASSEMGYKNEVIDDKNTWIKFRLNYEQNAS